MTILLYIDDNYSCDTNTYFPPSSKPKIMPESYFASRKLAVIMIYGEVFHIARTAAAQHSLTVKINPGVNQSCDDIMQDWISFSPLVCLHKVACER